VCRRLTLPLALLVLGLCSFASTGAKGQAGTASLPAGLALPNRGGIYAVDSGENGSTLTQLHATEILSNSHAGSNFARGMVYAGPHSTVELDGINAATHLSGGKLSFLVRVSDDSPDIMRNQLALVGLRQTANHRVVSSYSQNVFGGQHKRQYDLVAASKTDVGDANASWVLLTPLEPLPPGEYGIVFIPKDPTLFGSEVYDFNVTSTPQSRTQRAIPRAHP
jgi:hypothetical protein